MGSQGSNVKRKAETRPLVLNRIVEALAARLHAIGLANSNGDFQGADEARQDAIKTLREIREVAR